MWSKFDRLWIAVVFVLFASTASAELSWVGRYSGDSCATLTIPAQTAETEAALLSIGAAPFTIELEPDTSGAGTTTIVSLEGCAFPNTTSCYPLQWDTDGDGIVDNNQLTGAASMKRGVTGMQTAFLRILITTAPGAGETGFVSVCGMEDR